MKSYLSGVLHGVKHAFSSQPHRRHSARLRRAQFFSRPLVEALEHRRLLALVTFDNDNWNFVTDNDASGSLTTGDTVRNDFDTINTSGITATYGVDAFGTVTGGAFTGSVAGAATINDAIANTDVGGTVNVLEGTYTELVNVNKSLSLLGAQANVSAETGRVGAAESIVTGAGGLTPINISASDVELNGFTIQGVTSGAAIFGVILGAGTSGSEIRNNIIQNNIAGLSLANNSTTNQTIIELNLFRNNNNPGPISGTGIYTDQFNAGGALTNVLIDHNTFTGHDGPAINLASTLAGSQSNITVSENVMSGNGNAILFFNTANSLITDNEIFGSLGSQIGIFDGSNGITITENFIEDGLGRGIRIADFGGGANSNISINRNSIEGNAGAGLELGAGAYLGGADSLNAEFNWWGSASGPTHPDNPTGTGEEIVDPLGQVDFEPWLPNGVDTQPAARGFQPSVADLSITKDDAPDPAVPGSTLTYTIVVTNNGPDTQVGATVTDDFPAEFTPFSVTTTATGGATGATANLGDINDTVTMPPGSTITYIVSGTIDSDATGTLTNTATVTAPADTFETDLTNNTDTTTTALTPEADVSVTKTDDPDPVIAGENLTFTIVVTNSGASDAQGVTLTDVVPANTTFVSMTEPAGWTVTRPPVGGTGTVTATSPTVVAGDVDTFTLVVRVSPSTPDGSFITNTAEVSSTTPDPDLTDNTATTRTDVDAAADLSVTKTDSPDAVIAGQNLTYTITVSNTGSSDAQTVALNDAVPAGTTFVSASQTSGPTFTITTPPAGGAGTVTATRATLAAGEAATFQMVVNVNANVPQGGTITNTAVVASATTDPDPADNTATETTSVNARADLAVSKTDSPDPVTAGNNLTYVITLTNTGSSDAQGVSLTDAVPTGTTFVSASQTSGPAFAPSTPPAGGTGTVTFTTATFAAGATATFQMVVNVNANNLQGSSISNTATVTSTTTDPDPSDNSDTESTAVIARADVSVNKTDSPDPVFAGSNLTYTITVSNTGVSDAQGVSLTDAVPAGTTFVSASQTSGPAFTISTPPAGGAGTVTATRATLAAGAAATFTMVVNVNASNLQGSTITNTANVTSTTTDPDPADNSDTETTNVNAQADLSVSKTDSPEPVTAGELLTYTILVTNSGTSDAQGVSLTDAVPANTTFVSFDSPAGWTDTTPAPGGAGPVTSTRPTLAAGATATFTLVVRVNASALSGTTITNTATIASSTADPDLSDNTDTETTAVVTSADVSVTKTDNADPVAPGDELTYTIIVRNNGSSDAQAVSLEDVIPPETTFVSFAAPAGWSTTTPPPGGTGTVTATRPTLAAGAAATFILVVQVDSTALEGTVISNTATVTSTTGDSNPANNSDTETTDVVRRRLVDCEVTTLNSPGNPGTAQLDADADGPGQVLIVTGTSGNDVIIVEPRPGDQIRVRRNGRVIGTFDSQDVDHIVVFGLSGNDKIIINASLTQPATLFGDAGNDALYGARGDDGLDGGSGNDVLFGGSGDDILCGGTGNDKLYGQHGNDTLGGESGNDRLFGESGDDHLQGGDGNDSLYGGSGNDRVFGQAGNDSVFGEAGNDIGVGGDGNDRLFGGVGLDLLIGGDGSDTLFGEASDDIVVAGPTTHDEDEKALMAILAEWISGNSYSTRVNNIRNGGGANGIFVLNDTTVIDDGRADTLWGKAGQDWFLLGAGDRAKDRVSNEQIN